MSVEAGLALATAVVVLVALVLARRAPGVVVGRPRTVLAVLLALSLAAGAALVRVDPLGVRLSLDPSEEPLLPLGNPARDVYRTAVQNFGDDDVFVIAMETEDGVFQSEHLRTLARIGERVRRLPGVRAAESLLDVTSHRYDAAEDTVHVGRLIDEVPTDPAALAELRGRALADRIYTRSIVAPDGRTAAINVTFRTMTDREFVAAGLDERIAAIVREEARPRERFLFAGRQHVKAQAADIMVRDVLRLIPLAVIVGAAVAWLMTGTARLALVPVGASLLATLWTFGLLAACGRPLNLITIVMGPALICIGSVYGVHVIARFDVLLAELGDRQRAARACVEDTWLPVMISGVTTVIGFAALLVSRTPAIREFGVFSLAGVALMTALALTGIPAALALLPPPRRLSAESEVAISRWLDGLLSRLLAWAAAFATGHPTGVLVGWTVLTVAALACIPRIVVDTDYLSFFDPRSAVRRDFADVSRLLVGAVPIYVTLDGGSEGAFREPDNLRALERLQRRVEAVPGVSATVSAVDLVRALNRTIERDDPAAEVIPATRSGVADVLFLVPKARLRRFANTNHSAVNLLVRTGVSGSHAVRDLEAALWRALDGAALPPALRPAITGNTIVFNGGSDAIAGNQLASFVLTVVSIGMLVCVAFRSLRFGVVAMLPNLIPVVLFFGLLGAGLASLSLPTSLIASVALGIAIDDTAHFLTGYRRVRLSGASPEAAVRHCLAELGKPVAITSLMLTAGYLVLCFSGFATLREFGYLSALTMAICLWGDLLMLPAILVRLRV